MAVVIRFAAFGIILTALSASAADVVTAIRTPDGGIQPQAIVDRTGTLHLIYYKGDPAHGDLFYVKQPSGQTSFSQPLRVNSQPGTAIAIGTIRGGQIALGRDGYVHIVWNGPMPGPKEPSPLSYTRLKPNANAFDPQRNLITSTIALDGGGTIAADASGHVFAAWHARGADAPPGEGNRRLWVASSSDDGASFSPEKPAFDEPTGACACCATKAMVDAKGTLQILYRSARNGVERDLFLLSSSDNATSFKGTDVHPWKINACPMSSMALANSSGGLLAAWETSGQVYFSHPALGEKPIAAPGRGVERKHPSLAVSPDGSILLAWTEGTGWQRGGALAWQVFDASGKVSSVKGRLDRGIPVWSLPTVVARPDGGFLIIH